MFDPKTFTQLEFPDLTEHQKAISREILGRLQEVNMQYLAENTYFRCEICDELKPLHEAHIENGRLTPLDTNLPSPSSEDKSITVTWTAVKVLHCKKCSQLAKDMVYGISCEED